MWPRLAFCCWGLALVSGWATFQQTSPSRNFSFRLFPEAAPGAPGRLPTPPAPSEEAPESKVERLGQAFRRRVRRLRELSERLELVFLVDESSSVGQANFLSELKFVRKLLSDFPVVPTATRVAIVTFSSKNNVVPRVDYISSRRAHQHKCALLSREIPAITYRGGGTYTKGAFQQAAQILRHSRENATKVIFLITDGYSNGGDPRPVAALLRDFGVEIFTFGIWQGNIRELNDMASPPKEEHCYLLHSFEEFEALARRALHEDLPSGSFIQEDMSHCSYLCEAGKDCCDRMASCKCGTHTGQFECVCEKGYYGKGLQYECTACPSGTYKPEGVPGGISTCLPCPDENHTSPPGSTSPEDCVCKEGYRASGQTCEVVHCPALKPPENGYFIQNTCRNHFNAACGVRCHPGFDLVGSSIFLCQPNGLWSGSESSCKVRTCPRLRQPRHGRLSCSTGEMSYRTTCVVTCDEGYRLEGSARLTCQGNAQWDSVEPRCVEHQCPTFQKPKGVIISPPNCGRQPAKPGTVCQLSCRQGFVLSGVREEVRCATSGRWSARVQTAVCKDVEAPQITCPKDIEAKTEEQQDTANITWQIPTAEDNSGEKVAIYVHPAFTPPYLFPIGDVAITYTAKDLSSNQASCTFHVRVIDVEPPSIDRCRSPPPTQGSGEKQHAATWDEPQFSDNSGADLVITRSHTPGDLFPQGETVVQYTATDPSGNNRTCDIHIVIKGSPCEVPFTPVNGDFMCTRDGAGVNCTLSCLEGYDFTEGSTERYYCAYEDGIWRPPYSTEWPDCAIKRFANHGFKSFETLYKATRCDDTELLKKFSEAFETTLGKMVPSFCNDADDIDCRLEDLTKKYCLEYNYDYENGFAIGPGGWGAANRLDYSYDDFLDSVQATPMGAGKARPSRTKRSAPLTDHKVKLIFNITASVPLPDERNDTIELKNQQRLINTLETITNQLKRTLDKEPLYSFQLASEILVADSNSLETEKALLFCRPGSVLRGRMCVKCPLGTHYSLERFGCESCLMGSYQDEEGQLECKPCPAGTHTEYLHSRDRSECKALCKQGTYSTNGLETCESCPLGSYQPDVGARSCLPCPTNTSTVKRGAAHVSACGVPCPLGEFSRSGLKPCYPCPQDYYQPNAGKSFCLACPFYGTTTFTGATSITDCSSFGSTFSAAEESVVPQTSPGHIRTKYEVSSQVFHECFLNPCHNSGTCQQLGHGYVCLCPPGYTGLKCETDIDECSSQPCLNNGTCKDRVGEFICECPSGYTGQLCEENINECSSSPCLNKGACIDGVAGYQCACVKGYIGLHCETEVNECQSSPCLNNAVCEDQVGKFLCKCPPGFLGTRCEKNIDECLSQPCKNGATCKDGVNSFRCQCAAGFTGPLCELNINECQSNPCRNQATCVDKLNSYSCKCRPGFSGSRCETEQSTRFNLDFEVSGIYGYVILDGVLPSLRAVTCAFWMKSSDINNYGTPISYALENGSDNTFLLTDYNGWVLYVNGKERITDCPSVNDGTWHHIAITWTSVGGAWKVYIDGKLSDGGMGLSVGSPIPGGGALVLGQEQDIKGEGFNPAESFVGSISQLNLWDYVLTPQQVKSLATSCPEELTKGNVLAWPDFLPGIVGRVKVDSKSIFCSDCPPLEGSIPHLRATSVDLKPGSNISLFCDPGFQMVGNPVQYCLNQGQWTQPLPRCERISCGVPPSLENGFYSAEDFHAGSTVTYQCNNGYYLLGDSRMFCTNNGSWNGISPSCIDVDECALGSDCSKYASCLNTNGSYTCLCLPLYTGDGKRCAEPIKCKAPRNPENGHSSGEVYTVGAEVTFSCGEGHQLNGAGNVTCLESGEWSHPIPSCEAISCGAPALPENGGVDGSAFTYGSKVMYRCDKGYTLEGDKESSCLANGSWSHSSPVCELVKCSSPDNINHGKYVLSGLTYLSTASYSCDSGYSLQGPSILECTASGSWDRAPPTCHLVFCGEPPAIKDAVTAGSNFTVGNTVTYTCKEGYTLAGPDTIECLASGKWSSSNQQCLAVSCDEPPHVEHASPETAHRLFGDIAFYYCSDGYSLADNSQLLCNAQGKWVPPEGQAMPHCIAHFCENPPSVSYSILESVSKAKFAAGSVVSFKCMEGFVLNTSAKIECVRGGQWSPSPLTIQCIPVRCGEPPSITNGYASGSNYSFGAVVAYSCNKGFYIKGEKKSTCEATGQWSSPIPTCHPVSCNEPPKIENGFLENATGRIFESEARYQCNPGYELVGSPVFVCQANRHWHSDSPLSCVPLRCERPPPIQNGYVKGENFEVGSKVQFFCHDGYELIGDTSWTCQKSGKWNKKPNQKCVPAKCPDPPLLENQLVLKELSGEVGVVTFSCKEGHALQGPSVLRCLSSQQWNDSFPVCKMVLCLPPPLIAFGISAPASNLHFGSTVEYSCVDGFSLTGESSTSCQADGTWSSPLPECVPVECPQPEEVLNGIVDVHGLAYLSTAFYTCKPGFQLVGNTTILCGEKGHWLGGTPTCKLIQCPKPQEISNGEFSYRNQRPGETITYYCDPGFKLEGPQTLTCLERGDWDTDAPSCSAIHCDPPQPIENGFVEGADYSYGSMVIYSCFPGFQMVGHAMHTCGESGWSSSIPTCVPIDCGLPPQIDFGNYTKVEDTQVYFDPEEDVMEVPFLAPHPHPPLGAVANTWENSTPTTPPASFLHGTTVSYACHSGYELLGNPVLTCQEDGTWSGGAPSCISIKCDLPVAPENGFLHVTETTLGSAVQYNCRPGHTLVGPDIRLCLQSKEWSGASPRCEAIACSKPNAVPNGSVKGNNYTYLSVVHYECDPGYVLNGTERRTCQENRNWDGREPVCIPVDCGAPPVSANGRVRGDEHTFQKEVEYACDAGFLLEGAGSRVCLANGSWSGTTPTCVPVQCATPPPLADGETDGLEYGFGKEVTFRCQEGYMLHGAPKLTCQSDGNWDAEFPLCKPVNCGPPENASHSFPNGLSFYRGGHIQYQCFPGYKLHGSPSRRCLSNGSWSGSPPSCLPCRCATPVIEGGTVNGTDFDCGKAAQVRCFKGFRLLGPSEITCEANGQWSSGFPRCEHVSCGSLPAIPNAFVNESGSSEENVVTYSCRPGYAIQGSADLICTETGAWSQPHPVCQPLSCGPPPSVANAVASGEAHTYDSKVKLRCLEGYMMDTDIDTFTCQKDGHWFPERISCSPKNCSPPANTTRILVHGDDFSVNKQVSVSCVEGYAYEGVNISTCQPGGTWEPPLSDESCSPVSCGEPESPRYGFVVGSEYSFGSTVIYQCEPGYELEGDMERVCQENSQWSGGVATCKKPGCEVPLVFPNGKAEEVGNTTTGPRVLYSCNRGYSLEGAPEVHCTENGTWSHPAPHCKPNPCPVPFVIPENAVLSEREFYVDQNVSIQCKEGFLLQGQGIITCNPDETWTQTSARCKKISCGLPSHVQNAIPRGIHYQYGDMIIYSCYGGYMMEGSFRRVCLKSGNWTSPPVCRAVCRFPCQNGGVCQRPNACSCPDGWMGRLCEEPICILPCLNGGRCVAPYQCSCTPGWTGSRCHTAVCQSPCLNGGRCVRPNRCHCPLPWTGHDCSRKRRPGF
ncbi:sushi, von Willebrand factor type A, EGF and pentraxin domain containing 1 [Phyllostomus discolor]|uniref:Sushi, von Willebrand factor type A, EGF and pentraxin domain-containing protein 1 n=5 Tax=Phyllostomus discolor TaxID=89673 RepID=A0A6J2MWY5_9CHIR|nr:sushi, von Willebrand factor type A, EGF and pentraxin domain-containing protein 1 [Phyllostomus discolor]KAF6127568.1 sushi, von Willebrand factor type A, EGF and pentraxin domain containing 1 [Phyllostomus discolor]